MIGLGRFLGLSVVAGTLISTGAVWGFILATDAKTMATC
jgi:hypothetical protein